MSSSPPFQAIILAGGGDDHLFPLHAAGDTLPKILLPIANRPMITFPLRSLEEAGVTDVLIVCEGDGAAAEIRSWVVSQQHLGSTLSIEVLRVAEELPSASALRFVLDRIKSENVVVMSGDVVTEVPLRAQLLQHQLRGATVTALFGRRKTSPAADTKPGKPPRNVDYVGLANGDRLVYFNHSEETVKEVVMPENALRRHSSLAITTCLVDMQIYVFQTIVLRDVLQEHPELLKLEDNLLPFLARRQGVIASKRSREEEEDAAAERAAAMARASSAALPLSSSDEKISDLKNNNSGEKKAANKSGTAATVNIDSSSNINATQYPNKDKTKTWLCIAYIAPEGVYCQRANTLQGYADVNREVVLPELAPKLLGVTPSARGENFLAPGVVLGNKATVSSGCTVGSDSTLGDKCSVKRSVIGRGCALGANVKIINSVLMDNCHIAENCHVQNSIVSSGCTLHAGSQVKDCQLGPGYVVAPGSDHRSEILTVKK